MPPKKKDLIKIIPCVKCHGINSPASICPACNNSGKLTLKIIKKESAPKCMAVAQNPGKTLRH